MDHCTFFTTTDLVVFRLYCTNDLPGGLNIRNSYFENLRSDSSNKPPFRFWCAYKKSDEENSICSICDDCLFAEHNKRFPWVRLENNIFNNMVNSSDYDMDYIYTRAGNLLTSTEAAVCSSNSYFANCYRNSGIKLSKLS